LAGFFGSDLPVVKLRLVISLVLHRKVVDYSPAANEDNALMFG
jgi:hypothetical protein